MNKAQAAKEVEGSFGSVPDWMKAIPDAVVGDMWGIMKNVELGKTEIPNKYKELIGLAVAATLKCRYCAFFHTEAAKANGATNSEIKEALVMASATNLFSTWLNGNQYDYDKFEKETMKMLEFARKQATAGK
jgi:AhpD family alkylhydroperoxidase